MKSICHTLVAAKKLSDANHSFSIEDLIVESWKELPLRYGIEGFNHPDSNKVLSMLLGKNGLINRGFITKCGSRCRLSKSGADKVNDFLNTLIPHSGLDTETRFSLQQLLERSRKLIVPSKFSDACKFWGTSNFKLLEKHVDAATAVIESALSANAQYIELTTLLLNSNQLRYLSQLHCRMVLKFSKHFGVILARFNKIGAGAID